MEASEVSDHDASVHFISRRSLIVSTLLSSFAATSIGRALGATSPILGQVLLTPTNSAISLSLMASQKINAYIEIGTSKSVFPSATSKADVTPGTPVVFKASNLKPNTSYFYRIRYKTSDSKTYQISKTYSFTTQRAPKSTFAFTVHGDTHPERKGKMFNEELYLVTLGNILSQKPDFHIMLGDDFSIDPLIGKGAATEANVNNVYLTHRKWLESLTSNVPLFAVNGNHEQAAAYLLDGTLTNPAVLAGKARNTYFPMPSPDNFYTGDKTIIDGVGLLRDYYAWEWGDALFVTLDPYWHSKNPVDNVAGDSAGDQPAGGSGGQSTNAKGGNKKGATATPSPNTGGAGNGKTKDLWTIGIGDDQYFWLKDTLEKSKAKYKFVFAHHVMGTGRGAVEVSTDYEWGGRDPKGQTTFAKERPNWELPIHDLMVKNGVSIFFQGHDHIFVTQERDGLIYQAMPNPADDTFSMFNDDAYKSGTKAPNSGHVRVTVSPTSAKVEYFLAARPQDSGRKNLQIAHTYTILPRTN